MNAPLFLVAVFYVLLRFYILKNILHITITDHTQSEAPYTRKTIIYELWQAVEIFLFLAVFVTVNDLILAISGVVVLILLSLNIQRRLFAGIVIVDSRSGQTGKQIKKATFDLVANLPGVLVFLLLFHL